jgi:hypothetical protein
MGGARAPIDPGLQNVALCLGQWDVPGLFGTVHSAACDLATGQNCSAVDNCAAGWHVCTDLDLMMKGFTPPLCSSIASGMWVTAVRGDMNFNCSVMGDDNLFGCGAGGALPGLCLVVDKVWRAADCGGPWSCGDPAHEASYVTKSDLTGGGLICCHD